MATTRRHRTAFAYVLFVTASACGARNTVREPSLVTLDLAVPVAAVSRCEVPPAREARTGHTPAPTTSGALTLVDDRGDDRIALTVPFAAAWSRDGEHVVTATRDRVLVWRASTGALERNVHFNPPFYFSALGVDVSPDGAWIAVSGIRRVDGTPATHGFSVDTPGVWLIGANEVEASRYVEGSSTQIAFTPDGSELRVGSVFVRVGPGAGAVRGNPVVNADETLYGPDGRWIVALVPLGERPRLHYTPELRDATSGVVLHRFDPVPHRESVALSGDGRRIAILDRGLSVFATDTFERVAQLPDAHGSDGVALSYDGSLAALDMFPCFTFLGATNERAKKSQCESPVLTLWNLQRGEQVWRSTAHAGSVPWTFTRDGRFLYGRNRLQQGELIRVEDGSSVQFGHAIHALSPDGRWALFEDENGLEIASPQDRSQPWSRVPRPRVIALSNDGTQTVTSGVGNTLRLERGDSCFVLDTIDPARVQLAFSSDGSRLVEIANTPHATVVRAVDTNNGSTRWSMGVNGASGGDSGVFATATQIVVHGLEHDDFMRFDAENGTLLGAGRLPRLRYDRRMFGYSASYEVRDADGDQVHELRSPTITREGSIMADLGRFDRACWLSIWNPTIPRRVQDIRLRGCPASLVLSPDEGRWALFGRGGVISWFTREGHRWIDAAAQHDGAVTAVAFSSSGDRMVSAGEDGTILVFDTATGRVLGGANLPLDRAEHLAIAPAGDEIVAETARGMRLRFRLVH